jgi:cell division septation protein DedD
MPLSTRHYRTAFAAILLAVTTLLSACSIWPKALSFSSEPKAEAAVPPPASVEPVVAVSAPPTVTELPKLDAPPKAEAAPKPLPKTPLAPGFYINVGLYAVPDNANTAYRKLETAGLPVFSDVVTKAQGPQTRVRVGPYPTRAKATAATKKIKALKLDAVVFKH